MANVIKFACKHCGQEIYIPAPQQAGMYEIMCPHCQRQIKVKYSAKPITIGASPQSTSLNSSSNTEELRHIPTRHFHSSSDMMSESSPQVQKKIFGIGRLSMVRLGCDKEYFNLRVGENTIGRKDFTRPSDIEIDGDPTISRRSVNITISVISNGYSYSLTVLNATNPVLVNGVPIAVGQSVGLSIGASIYMGRTMLRLEK